MMTTVYEAALAAHLQAATHYKLAVQSHVNGWICNTAFELWQDRFNIQMARFDESLRDEMARQVVEKIMEGVGVERREFVMVIMVIMCPIEFTLNTLQCYDSI